MLWSELFAIWVGLAGIVTLVSLHVTMDLMMDQATQQVRDEASTQFYPYHSWYLIVSTVCWLASLIQGIGFMVGVGARHNDLNRSTP